VHRSKHRLAANALCIIIDTSLQEKRSLPRQCKDVPRENGNGPEDASYTLNACMCVYACVCVLFVCFCLNACVLCVLCA